MNRIKFHVDETQDHPIERVLFETKTRKSNIFYRESSKKHELSQFAVCPACNEPVQIIGLYKPSLNTDKPYAKHVNYSLANLASYEQENYDFCPYRAERLTYHKTSRKTYINGLAHAIIKKLITKFDRIIYIAQKIAGIYISNSLAKSMLNDYLGNQAYLYPGSTLTNIPLMLLYFMRANTLMYRIIPPNTALRTMLESRNDISFIGNRLENREKRFKKLTFYFIDHRTQLIEHELMETLQLGVALDDVAIFEHKLQFDPVYAENLIHYPQDKLTEKTRLHNQTRLEIARRVADERGIKFD
ncbi:hypothetical protein [Aggregatibacter actinomycetemcomitans]|uniref:hypothetical protein n=1 Tax=Aggregatibacter actinomycetemcomitans TaxID=714 RepID=UPI00197C2DE4|nr:hypothetical protein [Aggregatibacter actinomycetemcomitans]MBN6058657.1 hypothetical protein [Aggregatibacter actinomycetemcomitans]MBN6087166.1 hypothetical protein [Aggregatibacter actinomycetemcomitans]